MLLLALLTLMVPSVVIARAEDVAANVDAFGGQNTDTHEACVSADVYDCDPCRCLVLQHQIACGARVIEYTVSGSDLCVKAADK